MSTVTGTADTKFPRQTGTARGAGWRVGDLSGGLAAAAVLLPQAMAFGVALYTPAGITPADGAYAGLLGTALLCLASGIAGGTRGLISSPTGPTLVLLGGALASLGDAGFDHDTTVLALAVTIILTGFFQFFIGLTGGGRLIKYIPYPVVGGFMLGSALLMIESQLGTVAGGETVAGWEQWIWLPGAAALVTIAAALVAAKRFEWLPGPIAGLLIGTVAFHAVAAFRGERLPEIWMIGELPGMRAPSFDIASISTAMPWEIIVPAALALAILSSLDTLLTAVIADVTTGARHDARRELAGQGIGQLLAGIFGGMGGAGTTAASVVAVKSGGRRWAAFAAGLCFTALLFGGGGVGALLPIPVLAGIIFYVAIGMIDLDVIRWVRERRTRLDAAIVLLVSLITVFYDLMAAVAVGVFIAIVLFIRSEIRAPVIHRRSTGRQVRSTRRRNERESAALDLHGERIVFYELRGHLFFATADRVFEEMLGDLDEPNRIVVHMRRVGQVDITALRFFHQIAARLAAAGGQLLFCNVHGRLGIGSDMAAALRRIGAISNNSVLTFNGKDEALEFAEDALLRDLDEEPTRLDGTVELEDNDLCRHFESDDVRRLQEHVSRRTIARGEQVFAGGDLGNEMFIVISGQIDIRLPTTSHHHKRLASCGPGSFFGELSLLKPGPRAADAVALADTEMLVLDAEQLALLQSGHPLTAARLLRTLCEIEVSRLRWSSTELQRLAES